MTDEKLELNKLNECHKEANPDAMEQGCSVCAPKLALTVEEEYILSRMRAIKQQARPIAERLKEIGRTAQEVTNHEVPEKKDAEWEELNRELDRLRGDWKEWENRLDKAIETKLVLLGHRQPR